MSTRRRTRARRGRTAVRTHGRLSSRRAVLAGLATAGAAAVGLQSVGAFSQFEAGRVGSASGAGDDTALLQVTETATGQPIGTNSPYSGQTNFDFTNATSHTLDTVSLTSSTGVTFDGNSSTSFSLAPSATNTVTFGGGDGQETITVDATSTGSSQSITFDRTFTLTTSPPVWESVDENTGSGSTTVTVTYANNTVTAGELLVVVISTDKQYAISAPAGWTGTTDPSNHNNAPSIRAFWKEAVSGDEGNPSFSFSVGHKNAIWCYAANRVTGHNSTTPMDQTGTSTTGNNKLNSLTLNLTPSVSNTLLFAAMGWQDNPGTITDPSGMSRRWITQAAPGNWGATETLSTSGSQIGRQVNWGTATYGSGVIFNVQP